MSEPSISFDEQCGSFLGWQNVRGVRLKTYLDIAPKFSGWSCTPAAHTSAHGTKHRATCLTEYTVWQRTLVSAGTLNLKSPPSKSSVSSQPCQVAKCRSGIAEHTVCNNEVTSPASKTLKHLVTICTTFLNRTKLCSLPTQFPQPTAIFPHADFYKRDSVHWEVRTTPSDQFRGLQPCHVTAQTRIQSRVRPCGICGGRSGSRTYFSPSTIPPTLHTHFYLNTARTRTASQQSLGTLKQRCDLSEIGNVGHKSVVTPFHAPVHSTSHNAGIIIFPYPQAADTLLPMSTDPNPTSLSALLLTVYFIAASYAIGVTCTSPSG